MTLILSAKHSWLREKRWCLNVAIMAWKESFGDWEQEALETENRKLLSAESLELLPVNQESNVFVAIWAMDIDLAIESNVDIIDLEVRTVNIL